MEGEHEVGKRRTYAHCVTRARTKGRSAALREERLFVSTTPGLEPALLDELREWTPVVSAVPGGAELAGPPGLYQKLNLHLRTASRVLVRVATFQAKDLHTFAAGLGRVPLGRFRRPAEPLWIEATTRRSRLSHTGALRDAAARTWGGPVGIAGVSAPIDEDDSGGGQTVRVQLRIEEDLCTVSIDSTGEILHRRGYRQEISRAPLRETLAAGILRLATYRGDEPLWDPMCGSGTLP